MPGLIPLEKNTSHTPAQLGAYSRWSTAHKVSHERGGAEKLKGWIPVRHVSMEYVGFREATACKL